jgi:hypothetical protein
MKYLFLVRNIRLVKVCGLWKQDPSSNWHCKILKWFTEAYIKNILVKLIFKTFTLENSKKKGLHIYCLDPKYVTFAYCSVQLILPRQSFQYITNCLLHWLCRKRKKFNGKEDEKI